MDTIKVISERIKDLREFSDFSVEDFAEKLNISKEEYLEYEQANKDWPIGLLYNIATALMIDPSVILFGKNSERTDCQVVYNGKGIPIERYDGYSFISLANNFVDRNLEPMIVTLKDNITPELVMHSGQEFNYVLTGSLRVIIGEKEFYLRKGDSIYFNAEKPHAQISMSKISKFLTIIQK